MHSKDLSVNMGSEAVHPNMDKLFSFVITQLPRYRQAEGLNHFGHLNQFIYSFLDHRHLIHACNHLQNFNTDANLCLLWSSLGIKFNIKKMTDPRLAFILIHHIVLTS